MSRTAARVAIDVAAYCSGALVMVSILAIRPWLTVAGLALLLTCGGMLTSVRESSP